MSTRQQIFTYVPSGKLEAAEFDPKAPAPTPEQLSEFSRALQLIEEAQGRSGVMATVPDELAANLQTFLTLKGAELGRFKPAGNGTLEVQFDSKDIVGWAGVFFAWLKKDLFDWHKAGPSEAAPLSFRVALFGDWATGLYGAPVCAKSIEDDGKYQFLMHLGDTYYAGTTDEIAARLVKEWPSLPGATNRLLNGNHEMYCGGRPYWLACQGFGQSASYFSIENEYFILAALDTAFHEHDLAGEQAAWVQALADRSPQKKLVLFSHHQPYSLLDGQGPKLVKRLSPLLSARRIHVWYWGHEHHCIRYAPHALWGLRGRCVGHGGFPNFRKTKVLGDKPPAKPEWKYLSAKNLVPEARILDGANPHIDDHPEDYSPNGYMSLEFDQDELVEIVHDADGTILWKQDVEKF